MAKKKQRNTTQRNTGGSVEQWRDDVGDLLGGNSSKQAGSAAGRRQLNNQVREQQRQGDTLLGYQVGRSSGEPLPGSQTQSRQQEAPRTSSYSAKPELSEDTAAIQQALIDAGYDVGADGPDGYHGANTRDAVKKFQSDYGLRVTGDVDERTYQLLMVHGGSGG